MEFKSFTPRVIPIILGEKDLPDHVYNQIYNELYNVEVLPLKTEVKHLNQILKTVLIIVSRRRDLDPRPADYKSAALPV